MTTQATTFDAKVRNLGDYQRAIIRGQSALPSPDDIAATLLFFTKKFKTVLREVSHKCPADMWRRRHRPDSSWYTLLPTLKYHNLFVTVAELISSASWLTGDVENLYRHLLRTIQFLVPFLTEDDLLTLPSLVSQVLVTSPSLGSEVIHLLVFCVIPMCFAPNEDLVAVDEEVDGWSVEVEEGLTEVLMITLKHVTDTGLHTMLVECLIQYKRDVIKDLLGVIAYGGRECKAAAYNLLAHYWPKVLDMANLKNWSESIYKVKEWTLPRCQRVNCINSNKAQATKVTLICTCASEEVYVACELPPPVLICVDCYDILKQRPKYAGFFRDIVSPITKRVVKCDDKSCRSSDSSAMAICSHSSCTVSHRPVGLCMQCHERNHVTSNSHSSKAVIGGKAKTSGGMRTRAPHVYQLAFSNIWDEDSETQLCMVDAIVGVFEEANFCRVTSEWPKADLNSSVAVKLLSVTCRPQEHLPVEALGQLVSAVFRWFMVSDQSLSTPSLHPVDPFMEELMDRVKRERLCPWLMDVKKIQPELILASLLPHPPIFCNVGGPQDGFTTKEEKLATGLQMMQSLGPHSIVTSEVWDYVMPFWLESLNIEVDLKKEPELQMLLYQTFHIQTCPMPFLLDKIYRFIEVRFESTNTAVQQQAVSWLQNLTAVGIAIPLITVRSMFTGGTNRLIGGRANQKTTEGSADPDPLGLAEISCFNCMLDVMLTQNRLVKTHTHGGLLKNMSKDLLVLMGLMLDGILGWCDRERSFKVQYSGGEASSLLLTLFQLMHQLCVCVFPKHPAPLVSYEISERRPSVSSMFNPLATTAPPETSFSSGMTAAPTTDEAHDFLNLLLRIVCENTEEHRGDDLRWTQKDGLLMSCMRLAVVHGKCLLTVEDGDGQEVRSIIRRLWSLLHSQSSVLSCEATHSIIFLASIGDSAEELWSITAEEYNASPWRRRFLVISATRAIWETTDYERVRENLRVVGALANLFSHYIELLGDPNCYVAQKTLQYLRVIRDSSLQCVVRSIEVQHDLVRADRTYLLHKLLHLQRALPNRAVLTYRFFVRRLQFLFIEEHMLAVRSELPELKVVKYDPLMMNQVIQRARYAIGSPSTSAYHLNSIIESGSLKKRSLPIPTDAKVKEKDMMISLPNTQTALASLNHYRKERLKKGDMKASTLSAGNTGNLYTVVESEERLNGEGDRRHDHPYIRQLITMVIQFLADSQSENDLEDEKPLKEMILESLQSLINGEGLGPTLSHPVKLGHSQTFNAYVASMLKLMDTNVQEGVSLQESFQEVLLRACSYPPSSAESSVASDSNAAEGSCSPASSGGMPPIGGDQGQSLGEMEDGQRMSWLQSLLIILYKYSREDSVGTSIVVSLVEITLNTLKSHSHMCSRRGSALVRPSSDSPRSEGTTAASSTKSKGVPAAVTLEVHEEEVGGAEMRTGNGPDKGDSAAGISVEVTGDTVNFLTAPNKESTTSLKKGHHLKKTLSSSVLLAKLTQGASQASSSPAPTEKSPRAGDSSPTVSPNKSAEKHCTVCGEHLVAVDDSTAAICIIALETFLSRLLPEAMPLLHEIMTTVCGIAAKDPYIVGDIEQPGLFIGAEVPTNTTVTLVPGAATTCALQFVRCTAHLLAPKGLLVQLFLKEPDDMTIRTIALALGDFQPFLPHVAILKTLEGLHMCKCTSPSLVIYALDNICTFLASSVKEITSSGTWGSILEQLEVLLKAVYPTVPEGSDVGPLFQLATLIFGATPAATPTGPMAKILDAFARCISLSLKKHQFKLADLAQTCVTCYRNFSKERGKTMIARCLVHEFMSTLRGKTIVPQTNFLYIIELICVDYESSLITFPGHYDNREKASLGTIIGGDSPTGLSEIFKFSFSDAVAFIGNLHAVTRHKVQLLVGSNELQEDTVGGVLKTAVAQLVSLEMSRLSLTEPKLVQKHLPWLYTRQSAVTRGLREFNDSVDSVRAACWLYLGGLSHSVECRDSTIGGIGGGHGGGHAPLHGLTGEDSHTLADLVLTILLGFVEFSKKKDGDVDPEQSVEHMSSLFYAFAFCQIWTVYCEMPLWSSHVGGAERSRPSLVEGQRSADVADQQEAEVRRRSVLDFWSRVTQGLHQLMASSRVCSEVVQLHMLSLIENLQSARSTVLEKVFPLWRPILFSHQAQLPVNLGVRLQKLEKWQPPTAFLPHTQESDHMKDWVRVTGLRLSQTEEQSSIACGFYSVT